MDAMNEALLEDSASENQGSVSGHSMLSVDVMDEAMLLLLGDGEVSEKNDDDEEEINFEEFLTTSESKAKKEESKASDEESDNSPTSVIDGENSTTNTKRDEIIDSLKLEEPQVVPLKQFENALALIQDLENRIAVLETDQQCLLEENEQLRETTNKQAATIADMEDKLQRFPKLMEQTIQEEAKLAAAQAANETKMRFWQRDLARQEQEEREEKLKKNRAGNVTTDSLKQADFLAKVVERHEHESPSPRIRPIAIFNSVRGFAVNRISGGQNRDGSQKEIPALPSLEVTSKESDDVDASNETNNGIEDDAEDSKVLDLMT